MYHFGTFFFGLSLGVSLKVNVPQLLWFFRDLCIEPGNLHLTNLLFFSQLREKHNGIQGLKSAIISNVILHKSATSAHCLCCRG